MRKILFPLFVLILLSTAVSTATAQNQIVLVSTSANSIVFTSTGETHSGEENWALTIAATGVGVGTGSLASFGSYTISQGTLTVEGTWVSPNTWSISQSGGLAFTYGPSTTPLLTGNLQLVSLTQYSPPGIVGQFNEQFVADLTITGGTLDTKSNFPNNAELTLLILFPSMQSLQTLSQGMASDAFVLGGLIEPAPTGEPASMILIGSGLVLLGSLLRWRRPVR